MGQGPSPKFRVPNLHFTIVLYLDSFAIPDVKQTLNCWDSLSSLF